MPSEHADKNGIGPPPPANRTVVEEVDKDSHVATTNPEREAYYSQAACEARRLEWEKTRADLAAIGDETDTDEIWSEVLGNLGMKTTGGVN